MKRCIHAGLLAYLLVTLIVPHTAHAAKPSLWQRVHQRITCVLDTLMFDGALCQPRIKPIVLQDEVTFGFPGIETQPAAAAAAVRVAQAPKAADNEPESALQSFAAAPDDSEQLPAIIQNITQPVVERVVNTNTVTIGLTRQEFEVALNELRKELYRAQADPDNAQSASVWRAIALTNKIDQLTGAAISGGTITNTSISGSTGSFTTLSAGDTELSGSLSVASTITGTNLTLSGTLTADTLTVATLTSSSGITAPYINATSTSATSTLSGNLSVLGETALATTTITGALTVNGNTNITSGGELTVGDKIIAPGEIGLGVSVPTAKLHVQSTDAAQTTVLVHSTSTQSAPLLDVQNESDTSLFSVAASGLASFAQGLSAAGTVTFSDLSGGFLKTNGSGVVATSSIAPSDLSLANGYVYRGSSSNTAEATSTIFIADSGNVGIGDTSPGKKLDVAGDARVHTGASAGTLYFGSGGLGFMNYASDAFSLSRATTIMGPITSGGSSAGLTLARQDTTAGAWFLYSSAGDLNFYDVAGGGTKVTVQQSTGNVGIGSTAPDEKLYVSGNIGIARGSSINAYTGVGGSIRSFIDFEADNDINITASAARVILGGVGAAVTTGALTSSAFFDVIGYDNDAAATVLSVRDEADATDFSLSTPGDNGATGLTAYFRGHVGIGTTDPSSFKLQVAGNIGPDANTTYDIGSTALRWGCVWTSGGSTGTCASDERLKDNIAALTFDTASSTALDKLMALTPRTFSFKDDPAHTKTYGLIAQEAELIAPELAVTNASTTLKAVKYDVIPWLVFKAVQELANQFNDLVATVSGFGESFTTKTLAATTATVDDLTAKNTICLGSTCVTEAQFAAVFAEPGNTPSAAFSTPPANNVDAPEDPPQDTVTISILGNNPATLSTGQTYTDLGANAQDAQGNDLSIATLVDDIETPSVQLDTSTPGEHTVTYRVIGADGAILAEATRTVIIKAQKDGASTDTRTTQDEPVTATSTEQHSEQQPDQQTQQDPNTSAANDNAPPVDNTTDTTTQPTTDSQQDEPQQDAA
jgi:hypothetical protein